MCLSICRDSLSLETTSIDARKIHQPFNLYLYDRHTFIVLIMCFVLYVYVYEYVRICLQLTISVSSAVSPYFFLSIHLLFPSFFFVRFKKMRTIATREEEESSIVRSTCVHSSVRSSRLIYKQYLQEKEKLSCYSVCVASCNPQFFFHKFRKKRTRKRSAMRTKQRPVT